MAEIKCPACWNDIPCESENCPCCGFALRAPESKNKAEQTQLANSKCTYEESERMSSASINSHDKATEHERKNKRIIATAIVFILIIIFVGVVNSDKRNRKTDRYNYSAYSNSDYYDYYGGTSYPKTGNEGALYKAKSYLNSSSFSYSGLIEQLEFEGFSNSEATYGADHCGANWKEQALRKAKSYLDSSSFSKSGLVEQLEFEGFTIDEAEYGVSNCGADWNQQAAKKAASYLKSHSNWTRSDLIDQLEYEGFSYEQASYGVGQNGF